MNTLKNVVVVLAALSFSGCVSEQFGNVVDAEHYYNLSGFSIQPPTGPEWYHIPKNDDLPNSILFRTVGRMPRDFSTNHPDFNFTTAFAYGVPINGHIPRLDEGKTQEALTKLFDQFSKKNELVMKKTSFDKSLPALCIRFEGSPQKPDNVTQNGVVRIESVIGYFCLHPDDDFLVIMESRNGATVEVGPVNRRHQLKHFFHSIRFTPRDAPFLTPTGSPSRNDRKPLQG